MSRRWMRRCWPRGCLDLGEDTGASGSRASTERCYVPTPFSCRDGTRHFGVVSCRSELEGEQVSVSGKQEKYSTGHKVRPNHMS